MGEIASSIAINTMKDIILKYVTAESEPSAVNIAILEAFNKANKKVLRRALEDSDYYGMGTTVTMAVKINEKAYIGHIGDSRAYIMKNGSIRQITQDHSLVAELVRNGSITEKEAVNHPQKNIITRALGTDENINADIFSIDFQYDDYLILCTDGLSNFVDKEEMEKAILNSEDCFESCKTLVSLANQRGGYDNITVVIVKNISPEKGGR